MRLFRVSMSVYAVYSFKCVVVYSYKCISGVFLLVCMLCIPLSVLVCILISVCVVYSFKCVRGSLQVCGCCVFLRGRLLSCLLCLQPRINASLTGLRTPRGAVVQLAARCAFPPAKERLLATGQPHAAAHKQLLD